MNEPKPPAGDPRAGVSRDQMFSALFINMVAQQANMAMMLLGRAPHPETGEVIQDLEGAQMFIEQLEMLEAKTRGNLNKQEEALLKQARSALQMAFVEAVDSPVGEAAQPGAKNTPPAAAPAPAPAPVPPASSPAPDPGSSSAEESKKKFTKKY